jgi:hypothetical protein
MNRPARFVDVRDPAWDNDAAINHRAHALEAIHA